VEPAEAGDRSHAVKRDVAFQVAINIVKYAKQPTPIEPSFSGAAPGLVGLTTTRFKVGAAGAGSTEVKVIVNGKESNTVILPIE